MWTVRESHEGRYSGVAHDRLGVVDLEAREGR